MRRYAIDTDTSFHNIAVEAFVEYLAKPELRALIEKPMHFEDTNEVKMTD